MTVTMITGDQPPELQKPAPDGLVRNVDAALCQQLLDIAKRQREPGIEPDRMLDDHRRKAMPLEGYRCHSATVATSDRLGHLLNVSMPSDRHPSQAGSGLSYTAVMWAKFPASGIMRFSLIS